jgi:hypothetical protein
MEPQESLPCSQEAAIGHFPKPDDSSSHSYFLKIHFNIIHPCLNHLFPPGFATTTLYTFMFLPMPAICPVHIVLDLTILFFDEQ